MNQQELADYVKADKAQEYKDALKALNGAAYDATCAAAKAATNTDRLQLHQRLGRIIDDMIDGMDCPYVVALASEVAS